MHSEEEYEELQEELERQHTVNDGLSDEIVSLEEEVVRLKKQVGWLSKKLFRYSAKYPSAHDWQDASRYATAPK